MKDRVTYYNHLVADRLERFRKAQGISQNEVNKLLGVESYGSKNETFSVGFAIAFSELLSVPPQEMIDPRESNPDIEELINTLFELERDYPASNLIRYLKGLKLVCP